MEISLFIFSHLLLLFRDRFCRILATWCRLHCRPLWRQRLFHAVKPALVAWLQALIRKGIIIGKYRHLHATMCPFANALETSQASCIRHKREWWHTDKDPRCSGKMPHWRGLTNRYSGCCRCWSGSLARDMIHLGHPQASAMQLWAFTGKKQMQEFKGWKWSKIMAQKQPTLQIWILRCHLLKWTCHFPNQFW